MKSKPGFGVLWAEVEKRLAGIDFIAAHNASFDRSVLRACCPVASLERVKIPFVGTVKVDLGG